MMGGVLPTWKSQANGDTATMTCQIQNTYFSVSRHRKTSNDDFFFSDISLGNSISFAHLGGNRKNILLFKFLLSVENIITSVKSHGNNKIVLCPTERNSPNLRILLNIF
jgi:hypothetical protein